MALPQSGDNSPVFWMEKALHQATNAAALGEVPVGAVIVRGNRLIAASHNLVESRPDPTAHAEVLALREAARVLAMPRLVDCDLYVTLEPCPMCAQAISFARIRRLYFGAYDPKGGGVEHGPRVFHQTTCHFQPEIIGGVLENQCSSLLKQFFAQLR